MPKARFINPACAASLLWLLHGLSAPALAQDASAPAEAAAPPSQPAAEPERTLTIDAYDIVGNSVLDQVSIEDAVYPYLGPDRTDADVDKARAALEDAYKKKGYETVVVVLPPQDASNGVIRLEVVEAKIGRVRVVGAKYTAPSKIRNEIPSFAEGQVPNFRQLEKETAELNRSPDRQGTPLLKPGRVPGTFDVDIKVEEKFPLHFDVEVNNDHNNGTDPIRLNASLRYTNLFQLGHTIAFTYAVAPKQRSDTEAFSGTYSAPIWDTPWSILLIGRTSNTETAALGGVDVLSNGFEVGVRGIRILPQFGSFSHSFTFGFDYKNSKEDTVIGDADPLQAPIRYWPVSASYTLQHNTENAQASATIGVTAGIRGLGSGVNEFQGFTPRCAVIPVPNDCTPNEIAQDQANARDGRRAFSEPNFVVASLGADYTRNLGNDWLTFVRLNGQYSNGPLIPSEQFSSGGLSTVRGYLTSELTGDDGFQGSLEFRTPSFGSALYDPLGRNIDQLRLFAFVDGALTRRRRALPGEDRQGSLGSAGGGFLVDLFGVIQSNLVVAIPFIDGAVSQSGDPRFTFSVRAEF